jgi:hypothetical protein
MLIGLFRMFALEAQQGGHNAPTFVVILLLFAIGLVLTFQAFSRDTASKKGGL